MQNVYQHILNCRYVNCSLKSCLPTWLKWDTGSCFTTLLADLSQHHCPKQRKGEVRRSSWAKLTGHCCWKGIVPSSLPTCLPAAGCALLVLLLPWLCCSSDPLESRSSSHAVKTQQQLSGGLMSWAGLLQGCLGFRAVQGRRTWLCSCRQVERRVEGGCWTDVFGSSQLLNWLSCIF